MALNLDHIVGDPIQVFCCPRVNTRVLWFCTSCSPRDDAAQFPLSRVEVQAVERSPGVSLASVASFFSGAHHAVADVPVQPGVVLGTLTIVPNPHVDLLQQVGSGTTKVNGAPTDDERPGVGEQL